MMKGGEVGGVIAASSTAEIALRLVKENSPRTMVDRVVAHIRKQGYFIVDKEPDTADAGGASTHREGDDARRRGDRRVADRSRRSAGAASSPMRCARATATRVVRIRTLGGGVPAGPFIDAFQVPTVGISLANYDDNQHTDNENLRLGNMWNGIVTLAALMTK